jgi:hypothetical protein
MEARASTAIAVGGDSFDNDFTASSLQDSVLSSDYCQQ